MGLISAADQERLRTDFAAMTQPVRLMFFTQTIDCEACSQTRQILDELPLLSDHITIDEVNFVLEQDKAHTYGIDRVPAIVVIGKDDSGADRDSQIRFLGVPAGYEFISLIQAIRLVGGGPSQISAANRARIAEVNRPIAIQVFTTPTCPHCPRAVALALEMAWANPKITAYAIEVSEYPDLARRYHVSGVPKTVVDDRVEILGALPEDDFIQQTLETLSTQDTMNTEGSDRS